MLIYWLIGNTDSYTFDALTQCPSSPFRLDQALEAEDESDNSRNILYATYSGYLVSASNHSYFRGLGHMLSMPQTIIGAEYMLVRCNIWPPLSNMPQVGAVTKQYLEPRLHLLCSKQDFTIFPATIFDDVRYLIKMTSVHGCSSAPEDESKRRDHDYRSFVTQCLTQASSSMLGALTYTEIESSTIRCIQLAKMLFLYAHWPAMSVTGVYCQATALALQASLMEHTTQSDSPVYWLPEVLCWILVNGAISEHPLQDWFLQRVAIFTHDQHITTYDQFQALIREVAWTEGLFKIACKSIWTKVSAMRVL